MQSINISIDDYVSGEKFIALSHTPFNTLNSNTHLTVSTEDGAVIYSHTHNVNRLLEQINPNQKITLITHNSDGKVTTNPNPDDANLNLATPGIIRWFGCNILEHNDKTVAIPTGLENSCWFPEINKQRCIHEINQTEKKVRNLCYMNFNIQTNFSERSWLYNHFRGQPWVTTVNGGNGHDFHGYLDSIYNHKFVLCPEGNSNGHPIPGGGVASHRAWECLYARTIPIMTRGTQANQFNELPILLIDDWNEVTEDFLNAKYVEFQNRKFNFDKLKMSYWKNIILND